MPELVLHVGTHKTGTTSIQHFCNVHQGELQKFNIYWPKEKVRENPTQHSILGRMLSEGRSNDVQAYFDRVKISAAEAGCERIFLSGERLSLLTANEIRALQDIAAMDMRVVVYFWNIYDYALSTINQLMELGKHRFDGKKIAQIFRKRFNYSSIIETWEQQLGTDNVAVYSYDEHKKELIQHFFRNTFTLELPEQVGKLIPRNESLDLNLMMNVVFGEFPTAKSALKKLVQSGCANEISRIRYQTAQYYQLARIIVEMTDPDLSHPKLAAIRRKLVRFKDVQNTDEDRKAYFLEFANMIQNYYKA